MFHDDIFQVEIYMESIPDTLLPQSNQAYVPMMDMYNRQVLLLDRIQKKREL
jgi:hypothetical protein